MQARIKQLERAAQLLEPNQSTRTRLTEQVMRYSEQYLAQLPSKPAYQTHALSEADLATFTINEAPIDMETALGIFQRNVEKAGITMSPGMMAFVPGNQVYPAALADYLAAVVNKYVGVYAAAPGAVRLERALLRWMADFIGYPASAAGDLTSGGSIVNRTEAGNSPIASGSSKRPSSLGCSFTMIRPRSSRNRSATAKSSDTPGRKGRRPS